MNKSNLEKIIFPKSYHRDHKTTCLLPQDQLVEIPSFSFLLRYDKYRSSRSIVIMESFGRVAILGFLASILLNAPLIVRLRGDVLQEISEKSRHKTLGYRWMYFLLNTFIVRVCLVKAQAVAVNSHYLKQRLEPLLRRKHVRVVHNPYIPGDVNDSPVPFDLPSNNVHLLSATNLDFVSKIEPLTHAIRYWTNADQFRRLDIQWIICGDGLWSDQLRQAIDDSGVSDRITYTGWVNEMDHLYDWSDIFVHLTGLDAFPSVTMEALMNDCPVLTNRKSGGTREQILDRKNGMVVDDGASFQQALRMYANHPSLRKQHAAWGKRLIQQKYSVGAQSERMKSLLEEIRL